MSEGTKDKTTKETAAAAGVSSVVAKLTKYKEDHADNGSFELPMVGINVTFPKFINHGMWLRAERLGKNDLGKTKTIYLQSVCRFEGEKLTLQQFSELLPATDVMELMGEVMGGDDDEDGDEDGGGQPGKSVH